MHQATGVYEELPGWHEDISECRDESELPQATRDYLQFISDFVNVPITLLGVGPARDQVIWTEAGRQTAPAMRAAAARAASHRRPARGIGSAAQLRPPAQSAAREAPLAREAAPAGGRSAQDGARVHAEVVQRAVLAIHERPEHVDQAGEPEGGLRQQPKTIALSTTSRTVATASDIGRPLARTTRVPATMRPIVRPSVSHSISGA
jgi:hypothetical protein